MAAESSHRKKRIREENLPLELKKQTSVSSHFVIQMSMPQTLSLQGQDMSRTFFSLIQTKFEWL